MQVTCCRFLIGQPATCNLQAATEKMINKLKIFLDKHQFIKDVILFAFLILAFHFFYRAWANWWHFWPIKEAMTSLRSFLSYQVFVQSVWIDTHIFGFNLYLDGMTMRFPGHGYITINSSCSGFKQFMQFIILMVFFPGPWKHKLWFIPLGVFIVHLTNLFRIIGLSFVTVNMVEYWHFAHDNIFRPFFYVVMFAMWVWWVEKFKN